VSVTLSGRPSLFTDDLAETICDLLVDGLSMVQICARNDMPNRRTVLRWIERDDDFATRCARARSLQADLMDHLIQATADQCTPETANADRVKISAYQWRAAKLMPKVYGERLDINADLRTSVVTAEPLSEDEWNQQHAAGSGVAPAKRPAT
jgi:hypothetical protein